MVQVGAYMKRVVRGLGMILVTVGLVMMGVFGPRHNYAMAVAGFAVFALGAMMVW
jgi:hypothetical protein